MITLKQAEAIAALLKQRCRLQQARGQATSSDDTRVNVTLQMRDAEPLVAFSVSRNSLFTMLNDEISRLDAELAGLGVQM